MDPETFPPAIVAEPAIAPDPRMGPAEFVVRFFVVVGGVALGAVIAVFIGLCTGWISIRC